MASILIVIAIFVTMAWYAVFYILSVRPAQLEKEIGEGAYERCAFLRKISFVGITLSWVAEIFYFFFPLDGVRERIFDGFWGWVASISLALVLAAFGAVIMVKAYKAAPDSLTPRKQNKMFKGIYKKIRHPQAIGDVAYWFVTAFALNSFLLLIVAIIWVPVNYMMSRFEEKDLVIRYGSAYVDYMARTGRFLPLRPANGRDTGK